MSCGWRSSRSGGRWQRVLRWLQSSVARWKAATTGWRWLRWHRRVRLAMSMASDESGWCRLYRRGVDRWMRLRRKEVDGVGIYCRLTARRKLALSKQRGQHWWQ
ncbi:hypothetical protein B296_00024252 [Ensete ventricosum]|uniref:Uncharacterized protein n=1 Tax=Ensete ventricosum TaxID=4639 RepID=A0A426XJ42_ENSVE|nr:hypothetical protein B296_00024252 [Ensete ventricosum]